MKLILLVLLIPSVGDAQRLNMAMSAMVSMFHTSGSLLRTKQQIFLLTSNALIAIHVENQSANVTRNLLLISETWNQSITWNTEIKQRSMNCVPRITSTDWLVATINLMESLIHVA